MVIIVVFKGIQKPDTRTQHTSLWYLPKYFIKLVINFKLNLVPDSLQPFPCRVPVLQPKTLILRGNMTVWYCMAKSLGV